MNTTDEQQTHNSFSQLRVCINCYFYSIILDAADVCSSAATDRLHIAKLQSSGSMATVRILAAT